MTPVSGPYVEPNSELLATYRASRPVSANHRNNDSAEPIASHVPPGCLRCGLRAKMTVTEANASARPAGHRAKFQAVSVDAGQW